MINGIVGKKHKNKLSGETPEMKLIKNDNSMLKNSKVKFENSLNESSGSNAFKVVLEAIKRHLANIDDIFLKLPEGYDSSQFLNKYYYNLMLMYWHMAKIYEEKNMIEEAVRTFSEIALLVEEKFGTNNKAYMDANNEKARLSMKLSRRTAQPMFREKKLSNSQYVILQDSEQSSFNDRIRKTNEKKFKASIKKRSMRNLSRSSASQKDIKKISQRASMLIERSTKLHENLLPIKPNDIRIRSTYGPKSKQSSNRKSVRPKRNNWLGSSDKMVYMPFPGYEYKIDNNRRSMNRYSEQNMFNPISPFTQKPTNNVIFNDPNQVQNYYNNYLFHNSMTEAQKQLMEYSGLLNHDMTMNLLNRPLNDDEIRQIIKHRVAQTIDAVEEAKREYILSHSPLSEYVPSQNVQSYDIRDEPKQSASMKKPKVYEKVKPQTEHKSGPPKYTDFCSNNRTHKKSLHEDRNQGRSLLNFETYTVVVYEFVPYKKSKLKKHKISLQQDHSTGTYKVRVSRGKKSGYLTLDDKIQKKFIDLPTPEIIDYIKDHIEPTKDGYKLTDTKDTFEREIEQQQEVTPNETEIYQEYPSKDEKEEAMFDQSYHVQDEQIQPTRIIEHNFEPYKNISEQDLGENKSEIGIVDLIDEPVEDISDHYDINDNNQLQQLHDSNIENEYKPNSNKTDLIKLMQDMTRYKQQKKQKALQNKKLLFNTHKVKINDNFNRQVNMFVQSELLISDLTHAEALNLRKHQIALKVTGIKFKTKQIDFSVKFKRPLVIDLSFVDSTYDLPSLILDKYGIYMNNRLAIKTSSMELALNRIPKKMIHFYDLVDELLGKTEGGNKNKQSTFYGYMPGPSFTEMKYPVYKPSDDLDVVKKSEPKNKLKAVEAVKTVNEENKSKKASDKIKEPSKQPEKSPKNNDESENDSELERMYAEYSREVDERINFGHDSESDSPLPEPLQKRERPKTAKSVSKPKPKDYDEDKQNEGEEVDPELEELYAEYSKEVDDRVKFGHNSSSADSVKEDIEYDPAQDDDEKVEKQIEELERKMTEIRNKKPLDKVEESADEVESSVEYDVDQEQSSEGEEKHSKINLNEKITIKDLAEKYKI